LAGAEVTFGVHNLFDKSPSIIALAGPYSQYGDPRMRRFELTFRKNFRHALENQ
jgi:hypothetical protein